MKSYYSPLDVVRFLAAFWVMNFHYLLGLGLSSDLHWYRYGNLGVQLFFIISGFVIVQSLRGKSLREFMTGRFIRLFPLFWIACTATYVLTLIVPHAHYLQFFDYLRSMTMLSDIFTGFIGHGALIDPSYWTLTVELIFYVAIGIFAHYFSFKNIRYFLAVWFALSICAFIFHVDQNFYVKLLLVRHASYFIFGSALAFIVSKEAYNLYEKCLDWALLLLSASYSVYIHTQAIPAYITPNFLDNRIVGILLATFFVIVPILVYVSSYIKNQKVIQACAVVGGITYPLYLLHQTIGNTLINYITNRFNIPWSTFSVGFEFFIVIVAYGVYLQDKKLRGYLTREFKDQKQITDLPQVPLGDRQYSRV